MNGSSKIDSYLMPAKYTVSYHSVGFAVPGDSSYSPYGRCYLLILHFKRFGSPNHIQSESECIDLSK